MTGRDPIWDEAGPVFHWLGLGPTPPDGLHGHNRRRLTTRHTLPDEDPRAVYFGKALALSYPANREARLMMLVRPQRLDDGLWRMIYAVMVTGGPIGLYGLARSLTCLVSADRKVADAEAVRLYQSWSRNVAVAQA